MAILVCREFQGDFSGFARNRQGKQTFEPLISLFSVFSSLRGVERVFWLAPESFLSLFRPFAQASSSPPACLKAYLMTKFAETVRQLLHALVLAFLITVCLFGPGLIISLKRHGALATRLMLHRSVSRLCLSLRSKFCTSQKRLILLCPLSFVLYAFAPARKQYIHELLFSELIT